MTVEAREASTIFLSSRELYSEERAQKMALEALGRMGDPQVETLHLADFAEDAREMVSEADVPGISDADGLCAVRFTAMVIPNDEQKEILRG